jgi:type IV pilus assembly protein PilE
MRSRCELAADFMNSAPPRGERMQGFSLIELVIVLCALAIIALIALPSYGSASGKTRRAEGKILLQTVLAAEERYYLNFNRYSADAGSSGLGVASASQPSGYYVLTKLDLSSDGQSMTATVEPRNAQQNDVCGSLTLDSVGRRGATGAPAADCW